jgi:hypothetical protein
MKAFAKLEHKRLRLGNGLVECVFDLDGRCALESFTDLASGRVKAKRSGQVFIADRSATDLAAKSTKATVRFLGGEDAADVYQGEGVRAKVEMAIPLKSGATLRIERHLTVYDGAPALRLVDYCSCETPLAGVLLSDIASFALPAAKGSCVVYDYFSCTDQSNWRLIRRDAIAGKAQGFMAVAGGVFVYREGPVPDCQPYKTDYNIVFDAAKNRISMLGLGFDRIRPGETRRANGLVIGLELDERTLKGFKLYQTMRYKPQPGFEGEFHSNSWPAFELDVDEAKIDKELDLAAEAGLKTVFIDDGWFESFMGEIDTVKFPNKFDKLAEKAKAKGLKIGLWMNPMGMDCKDKRAALWDGAECHDTMIEGNKWNWMARNDDFHYVRGARRRHARLLRHGPHERQYFAHIRDKVVGLYEKYGICRSSSTSTSSRPTTRCSETSISTTNATASF